MRFFLQKIAVIVVLCVALCLLPLWLGATAPVEEAQVYLGGTPLYMRMVQQGMVVIGLQEVVTPQGSVTPAIDGGVRLGDVLVAIDGVAVYTRSDVQQALDKASGKEVSLRLSRDGQDIDVRVLPAYDTVLRGYRLGIYLKDGIEGIGTLTYVRMDNGRFGALGHAIIDPDTRSATQPVGGCVYAASIVGIVKGKAGEAGQLQGSMGSGACIGTLDSNTAYGVFGRATEVMSNGLQTIKVAHRRSVHTGEAMIYTTVAGSTPKGYAVEIMEVKRQPQEQIKGIYLKVTDPRLLAETGGIVQGMSGSPIVQDGRLVGAVTHVVVSDPAVGYGVFVDFMLGR